MCIAAIFITKFIIRFVKVFPQFSYCCHFRPFIQMLPWKHMDTHTHQSQYKNWLSIAPVQRSLNVFVFWMWCGDDDVQNEICSFISVCVPILFLSRCFRPPPSPPPPLIADIYNPVLFFITLFFRTFMKHICFIKFAKESSFKLCKNAM